ncbi:TPM domain-containing protein [Tahibacter harae]|uniref:TPM domain-containing protein n=1 Tax=Tahibacter harae TaxID=2963937 RepID=A0ABT1QU44_9GAMM|nr:TPM domain-containing protein [Tahibacter harae]MCQ4165792.1 TPM domain-containing protein [Tahibacter harae]
MNANILLHRNLLCAALSLAIAGCGDAAQPGGKPAAPTLAQAPQRAAPAAAPADEAALIAEVASSLQACSYDGSPLALSKSALNFSGQGAGAKVVAEIMKFTGLPQNFDVIEGQVPNAAAVIVLGPDQLPRRVIAYNRRFMEQVREATRNNDWAPVSIMAHEIGHHLSGHTITPGGSQPPTELEADKFSGFVLYKMGSSLADAQKALETLVPEQDGKTHPGRRKRVAAIRDGWQQACTQQSGDCSSGIALTSAKPAGPAVAANNTAATAPASAPETRGDFGTGRAPDAPAVAQAPVRDDATPAVAQATRDDAAAVRAAPAAGRGAVDTLPVPDTNALPSKFDRFVYDESGLLDPATRATFEQKLFDHAAKHNVEIVSLLVKDLHGLSADDYAYAMMRQLRVGKLDVGNGAVLVVAPGQGQVGVAMGPGVQRHMKSYVSLEKERLGNFLKLGWPQCQKKSACNDSWSESFFSAAEHIANDTRFLPWTIRYQSLAELAAADAADQADREANNRRYDPAKDPVRGQILRLQADLSSLDARKGELAKWVIDRNDTDDADLHTLQASAENGRQVLIETDPHTERLMPSPLSSGKRYDFIVRVKDAGFYNLKDPIRVELLSYSLMQ